MQNNAALLRKISEKFPGISPREPVDEQLTSLESVELLVLLRKETGKNFSAIEFATLLLNPLEKVIEISLHGGEAR